MSAHTLSQSTSALSRMTAPGPDPPAARSSSLPESSAAMLRGPRRVRLRVMDSSLDTLHGRLYLRRVRPVASGESRATLYVPD
jgi:hypothetical protein